MHDGSNVFFSHSIQVLFDGRMKKFEIVDDGVGIPPRSLIHVGSRSYSSKSLDGNRKGETLANIATMSIVTIITKSCYRKIDTNLE